MKSKALSVYDIVLCGLFAAVTVVMSQISVPVGAVPISCSLIAIYLAGTFLSVKTAVLSQVVYLLLGIVGVPVFAGFQSGVSRLAGPTGGYLVVYPIMALVISAMMIVYDRKLKDKNAAIRSAFVAATYLLSLVICYTMGTVWFSLYAGTGIAKALAVTVVPFIAGDIAKIAICTVITVTARKSFLKAIKKS